MAKSKLIFTADDYGVDQSIDDGIIDLVNQGIIQSVEILPNYGDNGSLSIQNSLRLLDETKSFNPNLELGVHFTITSGKPIKRTSGLEAILCKGHFISANKTNSAATTKAIYDELMLQANVLEKIPQIWNKITHLTNHHDALWFFPAYTDAYIQVANKLELPVRNPQVQPLKNEWKYYKLFGLLFASKEDKKKSRQAYKDREAGLFALRDLKYHSTHYLDSSFYSLWHTISKSSPYSPDKLIQKRQKELAAIFNRIKNFHDQNGQQVAEVLCHVRKGSLANSEVRLSEEFRNQMGADAFAEFDLSNYNGISTRYFDGRATEYTSLVWAKNSNKLQTLFDQHFVETGSWKDCVEWGLRKG
jgi:predicted glycoside hydrolase/deacetylase ChbG (UPF0249 family)